MPTTEPQTAQEPTSTVFEVDPDPAPIGRLQAALDGDRTAWEEIVREHTNLLWWIARSYRLDDATSADVVQTVWMQLVRYGHAITNPDRLVSWLATTARREALRRSRSATRTVPVDTTSEHEDRTVPAADERLIDEELTSSALVAFRQLGPECQRLLTLLCTEPAKSYQEIAVLLDRKPGSIGPTRQRCLAKLRTLMKDGGVL